MMSITEMNRDLVTKTTTIKTLFHFDRYNDGGDIFGQRSCLIDFLLVFLPHLDVEAIRSLTIRHPFARGCALFHNFT